MKGKKGIEIAMNYIVALIIIIVVFSFSIYFITTLFLGAQSSFDMNQQEIDRQARFISCHDKVCVEKSAEIRVKEAKIFGVRIKNVNSGETEFTVSAELMTALDENGNPLIDAVKNAIKLVPDTTGTPVTIAPNKVGGKGIAMVLPEKGSYIFEVKVEHTDNNNNKIEYGKSNIYVRVK